MFSAETKERLRCLGVPAVNSNEFISGIKLMQLICQVFYQGENKELTAKIKVSEQQKTGINVLNINILLNHLKKDPNIQLEEAITKMTAFKVIEEEEVMIELVEWILSKYKGSSQPKEYVRIQDEMSPPRENDNQFDNLYFVSSMAKKEEDKLNDSLDQENPQEKVVRKGSFKVFKPKVSTASKPSTDQNDRQESFTSKSRQYNSAKEPLKQIVIVDPNYTQTVQQREDDLQIRKTIPKMCERPPLYRSKQKEQSNCVTNASEMKGSAAVTKRLIDRDELLENIQRINHQIISEEKSLSLINNQDSKVQKRHKKSSLRKIFKMSIPETDEKKKKMLVEWLISINLLSASAAKFVNQLDSICKDGVVFVEIVNYYRGRGKETAYFKQPKRTAELNSNYQKLFSFLSQQIDFKSDLLHQYQYFVPEAQPNAFWSLLSSIFQCFNKRVKPRDSSINRYQNSINRKLERETSKKKTLNESASYHEIKYNSSSVKKQNKSNRSSVEMPRKETPTPSRFPSHTNEQPIQKQVSQGYLQVEEPSSYENLGGQRGYKEMYLNKFKNVETPKKNRSIHNSSTSLSRSRARHSLGSSKKKDLKPVIPSITLQMQMKVLKYLQEMHIDEESQELFKDSYRNGVLICQVVKRSFDIDCCASRKPKSIEDCRDNFYSAIETIKNHKQNFNNNYESLVEELLKGQRPLLYGLIYEVIRQDEKGVSAFNSGDKHMKQVEDDEPYITWIRSVERNYPEIGSFKIRNWESLHQAFVKSDFLFQYSWFITGKKAVTPTYERPVNDIQKESNLKKVLGYLVQSKIVRSDYLWKAKALINSESSLMRDLVADLVTHYNQLYKKEQLRTVNFVRYLKREDSSSRQKSKQKLQTTMLNNTLQQQQEQTFQQIPKLQIPWMRKLGFNGSLQLNSGTLLCKLMAKLNMRTIQGFKDNPQSRAECLNNIRKAIKNIPKFRWDQFDVLDADQKLTLDIYKFIKDRYKHAYVMKGL